MKTTAHPFTYASTDCMRTKSLCQHALHQPTALFIKMTCSAIRDAYMAPLSLYVYQVNLHML